MNLQMLFANVKQFSVYRQTSFVCTHCNNKRRNSASLSCHLLTYCEFLDNCFFALIMFEPAVMSEQMFALAFSMYYTRIPIWVRGMGEQTDKINKVIIYPSITM